MDCTIRPERMGDVSQISEVNFQAFNNQENESKLVELIRQSDNFIPELSLVADKDGKLIGHILISTIDLLTAQGSVPTLGLAPMAVKPGYQQQGIGSELVKQALESCKALGYKHIFVLGHPKFYPKFGFVPSKKFDISPPFPVPEEVFMALELTEGSLAGLHGKIQYPPAFNSVT